MNIASQLRRAYTRLSTAMTPLASRRVARVSGQDAEKFLQNLITNDVTTLESKQLMHAAMLSPQGRFLFDCFLTRDVQSKDTFYIDHCAATSDTLHQHLRRFRLRAKVEVEDVSDAHSVVALLGVDCDALLEDAAQNKTLMAFRDPRHDSLGLRVFCNDKSAVQDLLSRHVDRNHFSQTDEHAYDLYRTCVGVPSDPFELISGSSLPAESTLDFTNAISYQKGCYLGQELTARTHFRGVTFERCVRGLWKGRAARRCPSA